MSHLHHKISGLVDGELQGGARARAMAHIRSCPPCREEFQQTLALKQRLLGLPAAEPAADLFATLGTVSPPVEPEASPGARAKLAARRVVVGAGSVSVAVLSLAYAVGAPDEPTTPAVSPPVERFTADFAGSAGPAPWTDPALRGLSSRPAAQVVAYSATTPDPSTYPTQPRFDAQAGDDPDAVRRLHQAVLAPERVAYNATREVRAYDADGRYVASVQITHVPGQGTRFDAAGGADDATATFVTQQQTADAAGLAAEHLDLLVGGYDVTLAGEETVAGRPATVVAVSREGRLAARFWIDTASGLMVRKETYDRGRLVWSSSLLSLETRANGFIAHLPPELALPAATSRPTESSAALYDQGWTCPDRLPGGFSLTSLQRLQSHGDVVRATYSDGLSTVSVFEQRGTLDASGLGDFSRQEWGDGVLHVLRGLPTVAVWESQDIVYTVVTDAPPTTATRVLAALPHQPGAEPGMSSRVGAGLERIGSFVNPVD